MITSSETPERKSFIDDLRSLINIHGNDNLANTPDYILARYLCDALTALSRAVAERDMRDMRNMHDMHDMHGRTPSTVDPIPMLLWCPLCSARHIDEGDFATKPHHTHACQKCGGVWRPAIVATCGVTFLPGFKNDKATLP